MSPALRAPVLTLFALIIPSLALAWTGPTAAPPGNNVPAPINVGTTNQVKNGGVGVNSLAVFGNSLLGGSTGSNAFLNFGATNGSTGYGIRDNAGILEFKNSGGSWQSLQTIICTLVSCTGGGGTSISLNRVILATAGTNVPYIPMANTAYVEVEVWGGGGGGGIRNASGGSGGNSCFGTNATACTSPLVSGNGGGGGQGTSFLPGVGGTGGTGSGDVTISGQYGGSDVGVDNAIGPTGGVGGDSPRGGSGGQGPGSNGLNAAAVNGRAPGGGGAGKQGAYASYYGMGGGGGGGYAYKLVKNPSGTYYYTVGSGGSEGGSGAGAGAAGAVQIKEYVKQ